MIAERWLCCNDTNFVDARIEMMGIVIGKLTRLDGMITIANRLWDVLLAISNDDEKNMKLLRERL